MVDPGMARSMTPSTAANVSVSMLVDEDSKRRQRTDADD